MKKRLFLLIFFFIALTLSGIFLISKTKAQERDEGLTVSPPIRELKLNFGESNEQIVKLTNPTDNDIEVFPKVMDFRSKGEGGDPDFYISTSEDDKYALSRWVTFEQPRIVLTPKQVVEFKYIINVPTDAEPGGHYGVMFFVSEPPEVEEDVSSVALASMVGSLVLVKTPGEVEEKAMLQTFDTEKFFHLMDNKVDFITRISALGNVHIKPLGGITVKDIFGNEVDSISFNEAKGNVLPESTRKFENEWNSDKFLFGIYKAELAIAYGENGQNIIDNVTFVIAPWWTLIIIAVVFILVFYFTAKVLKKFKKKH